MSNALDIQKYRFTNTDRLFFDTNIWVYIYGPQGNPRDFRTRTYSRALADAMKACSRVVVDVLVISEFINRLARLEHQTLFHAGRAPQNFKLFRKSIAFQPIAKAIVSAVRNIVKLSARTDSDFEVVDIQALLTEFEAGVHDFNDQMMVHICRTQNLKLVTHDTDFKGRGVDILTANPHILNP
jgi:predicted nucleic acid-binding protein